MDTKIEAPRVGGPTWTLTVPGQAREWQWTHFDLLFAQARQSIEAHPALPEFARQVLTGTDETPRIVTDGTVVAGVLPAYARTGDADEFDVTCWHFAMTQDCLVTGRRRATRTLINLWDAMRRGLNPANPSALIDLCIVEFAREARARLAALACELDPVEDMLIEGRDASGLADFGGRVGAVRREATRLKRALSPLDRALDMDAEDLPAWATFSENGAGQRGLHSALDDISALYDRARSLQDELTTRLAEETNRRLYLVSVVTTLFMPATFVTGFFGMNTGGLLWGGDEVPHGTLFATVICASAVIVTLLLMLHRQPAAVVNHAGCHRFFALRPGRT